MTDPTREQIAAWVEGIVSDDLSPAEFQQLEQSLLDSALARELYLDLMHQHAHLQMEPAQPLVTPDRTTDWATDRTTDWATERTTQQAAAGEGAAAAVPAATTTASRWRSVWPWLTVAAGLLLIVIVGDWGDWGDTEVPEPVATIAAVWDAEWGECTLPTAVDCLLSSGTLRLQRGLATIRFQSGAEVTLEAPAELRLETRLRGHLMAGTAVVEVPDAAHGFVLSTPTAIAIDHGTAFAATVDAAAETAWIEVLDGIVEVQHTVSETSRRLIENERVVASPTELSDTVTAFEESELATQAGPDAASNVVEYRITTADGRGADASISRGRSAAVRANSRSDLVLIKHAFPETRQFDRKGYFRFDLTALEGGGFSQATFQLNVRPSGLGFASKVDDCEFVVFGLTDESQDSWLASMDWVTAPASSRSAARVDPLAAVEVGRFVVARGLQHGQVTIAGQDLVDFLNTDTNRLVTLIVVRATAEQQPGGLVHGFCNRHSSLAAPPTLLLQRAAPPRP